MKKVLGIIGSPRKFGNCELIIKEISRHFAIPAELKLLRLHDFNIEFCTGCYRCLYYEQKCVINDDLDIIVDSICECDALILAAPAYFLSANASVKLLLDRGLSFYGSYDKIWNKPAIGIGVAGIEGKEGTTLPEIEKFLKIIQSDIKGIATFYGALPGEVLMNKQNKKLAVELAKKLFDPSAYKKEPSCPLCGGNSFIFTGGNNVRCSLCSNPGTIEIINESPVFKIKKDNTGVFLTKKEALEHREWLRGMRASYLEKRDMIREIKNNYTGNWNWVERGMKV